jgi:tRNA G18 (ribose-2'-O)-methylase SpoU
MRVEVIESLDDPRVDDYRVIKEAALLQQRGVFIAEGSLVLERLLDPGCRFEIKSMLLTPKRLEAMTPDIERSGKDPLVLRVTREQMDGVVGFRFHQGAVAAGRIGGGLSVDEVVERAIATSTGAARTMLVVLEDLVDLDNVGSIFRNATALGAGGVLLSPRCADPLYRKAIRTSMGHALRLPFARMQDWPDGLRRLRELGFTVAAMTPGEGSVEIGALARNAGERAALLVGTEGDGLTRAAMAAADLRVRIPMSSGVDSLNVATACAVALQRLGERA